MESLAKSVLVTGTSQGSIGSALASSFAQRGLTVFATARDLSKINSTLSSLPNVHTFVLDVTSPLSITHALGNVTEVTKGTLDYLVNNAGIGYKMPLTDIDIETAKNVFDVNLWGVLSLTKTMIPLLVSAKGTVINISSVGAIVNVPWIGIYSASKAALTSASETLRLELAPLGVKVMTVMLGSVKTNFAANSAPGQIPEDSQYQSIQGVINPGNHEPQGSDVNKVAEDIVNDVLKGKTGKVYRGSMASATKFLSKWIPTSALDRLIGGGRGLDQVAQVDRPPEPASRPGPFAASYTPSATPLATGVERSEGSRGLNRPYV